jgi:ABC-type uncharacterized transport system ATPase subunit
LETPTLEEVAAASCVAASNIEMSASKKKSEDLETEVSEEEAKSIRLTLKRNLIAATLQGLMGRYTLVDMSIEEQSLEKVIQRLYESESRTP